MTRHDCLAMAEKQARDELAEDGVVSVSTFIAITDLGFDAETIITQLEEEYA